MLATTRTALFVRVTVGLGLLLLILVGTFTFADASTNRHHHHRPLLLSTLKHKKSNNIAATTATGQKKKKKKKKNPNDDDDDVIFDIRAESYKILKQSIPSSRRAWVSHSLEKLQKQVVKRHCLLHHPVLKYLYDGSSFSNNNNKSALLDLHLDFQFLTEHFTDHIMAMALETRQLRKLYGTETAFAARFLTFLNLLDELGLEPGNGNKNKNKNSNGNGGGYLGSPRNSHALLFEDVLTQLLGNNNNNNKKKIVPSRPVVQMLEMVASRENELIVLVCYLIVAEEEAMRFSPAMRAAVAHLGIVDVNSGYYMVHGSSDDVDITAFDDLHQNDAWAILGLLLTEENYKEVEGILMTFLDYWNSFWDVQLARINPPP